MTPHDELWAIVRSVCDPHGIDIAGVMGSSKHARYAQARQRCMRAIKAQTSRTLNQIGRFFRRHHTTVLHALSLTDTPFEELPPLPVRPPPHRMVIPQFARAPAPPRARYLPSPLERRRMTVAERLRFSERCSVARVLLIHQAELGPTPFAHFSWWLQEGQFLKSKASTLSQRNDLGGSVDADTHEHDDSSPCEALKHGEADECEKSRMRTPTSCMSSPIKEETQ